jgi:hypothetical protein
MRKSVLFLTTLCLITAVALAASSRDAEALLQTQRLGLEFRQGNLDAAKPMVKTLEAAVAHSPDNAHLWEQLGLAYMSLQGSLLAAQSDTPSMIAAGERARDAFARSLALEANNPLVLVNHGMAQMVVSLFKGDGPGIMTGVQEMDAAVRQAPKSAAVRLTRGFTIIHLPPAMRDTKAVIEDLEFIMNAAPGGRPEDVLHVLLGDVHAEMGNLDAARDEYRQVTGASAFAAEQVKSRMDQAAVPAESIARVRAITGTGCVACHAPGTDN